MKGFRPSTDLLRPLTNREDSVAELIGYGYSQQRVARALKLQPRYVAGVVQRIADALPNPNELSPNSLVMLWAARRRWTRERNTGRVMETCTSQIPADAYR